MKSNFVRTAPRRHIFQRKALVLAIGSIISGFAGTAWSQATRGTIQGMVPIQANEAIQITGGAGLHRTVSVDPSGKYSITLPVGTYGATTFGYASQPVCAIVVGVPSALHGYPALCRTVRPNVAWWHPAALLA